MFIDNTLVRSYLPACDRAGNDPGRQRNAEGRARQNKETNVKTEREIKAMTSFTSIAAQAAAAVTLSSVLAIAFFAIADFATRGLVVA